MSEFHPNRSTPVKTKLGLTRRRILEAWPLLVWVGIALLATWGYSRGRVFSRMNGAVDVYQENISPIEEGRIKKILVKRGDFVPPNTVIAQMDSSLYERELVGILRGVAANRYEEISRIERQQLDLEAELRKLEITDAGDKGRLAGLLAARDRLLKARGTPNAKASGLGIDLAGLAAEQIDDLNADIGELEGSQAAAAQSIGEVRNTLTKITAQIAKLRANAIATAGADAATLTDEIRAGLLPDEQKEINELLSLIELCSLRTTRGGTVDRLEKEEGEFVAQGEAVMRVVAEPDQIVAFLPQDQIGQLKIGDTVWITPAMDRNNIFESQVTAISPRINNLADATSPLPNRRLFGRDVVCTFPKAALPAVKGQPGLLVPGQTVTVHVRRPGDIPLMNRIFHNDDPN